MLAKCANPACSATFRYFHEGQLFAIESKIDSSRWGPPTDPEYMDRPQRVQYFWLCSACCCAMTFGRDRNGGVLILPNQGIRPHPIMEDNSEMVA
jgi:hypothetical protein